MNFRNLTILRFPLTLKLDEIGPALEQCQLKPVGPLELSSRGFVSPVGMAAEGFLAYWNPDRNAIWLTVGGEDRLLPGAAVNKRLQDKLEEIEQKEGRKPGGRTRKRLKDEIITDMLPHAFVKPSRVDAILDLELGLIAVDTASRKVAEAVASEVRRALGSFPALPLNAEVAPRSVMTGWLAGEALPDGLSMGEAVELRDPIDDGAIVKCDRMELVGNAEIDKHLQAGKQATRLALVYEDHVSFTIDEKLVIRKFKLLDGAVDKLESHDTDDRLAELDARFALMVGELRALWAPLDVAFEFSEVAA